MSDSLELIEARTALAEERARNLALQSRLDEETKIVSWIWELLGSPSCDDLKGRSIYDLIKAWIDKAQTAESSLDGALATMKAFLDAPRDSDEETAAYNAMLDLTSVVERPRREICGRNSCMLPKGHDGMCAVYLGERPSDWPE